ncbi:MAG TPA: fumarylacetoacetate hydrolase family protein [Enterovirga sp.]|jgi:2-keto-4-pentenoate hydratase/2-oxohepta-3-ene-1,7-dioic acid hydratase in catechol pathway|nr:fumarylacetoacetate hydrolase family protein [Enterovirga sp.]
MANSRREILTLAATAAAAGLAASNTAAQAPQGLASTATSGAGAAVRSGTGLRLVTFATGPSDHPRVGAVKPDGKVIDIQAAAKGGKLAFDPTSMVSLIAAGRPALDEVRRIADAATDGPMVDSVRLYAPIPNPARNVYAVGWNYLEHFAEGQAVREQKTDYPEHPVFFTKGVHTINGPYDPIPFDPKVSTQIDWECELAVVIGQRGRNISEADALKHVFGYTVFNDTTARDVQSKRHGGQWFKGKSLDGHGPIGPWIVPADQLDPDNLHLITRVNGVVKQDASTKQMYFKLPRIIAELSLGLTLEPGDIIATGTPPGVGSARKPPEFMKPGDVMETEIAEIGILRNTIQHVPV